MQAARVLLWARQQAEKALELEELDLALHLNRAALYEEPD